MSNLEASSDGENKILGIGRCTWKMQEKPEYRHPLGKLGHYLGILLLLSFVVLFVPMFVFTWIVSPLYFWFYKEEPISPKPYFHFDRHKVKYLSFWDKLGCEYCELANSTLQWMLAITNKIEKRWCPIQNECDPNCSKVKEWRKEYIPLEHDPKDLQDYYRKHYPERFSG